MPKSHFRADKKPLVETKQERQEKGEEKCWGKSSLLFRSQPCKAAVLTGDRRHVVPNAFINVSTEPSQLSMRGSRAIQSMMLHSFC